MPIPLPYTTNPPLLPKRLVLKIPLIGTSSLPRTTVVPVVPFFFFSSLGRVNDHSLRRRPEGGRRDPSLDLYSIENGQRENFTKTTCLIGCLPPCRDFRKER